MTDCCAQPGLMTFEQALKELTSKAVLTNGHQIEKVFIENASHRILADAVTSPINVPGFDNSAMDGYAVKVNDLKATNQLKLVGKSFAGHPYNDTLKSGECIRIMTGAVVPDGADAVVMQENTSHQGQTEIGQTITFSKTPSTGDNIRKAGEDIKESSTILKPGKKLTAGDIGLIASLGIAQVSVYRKITIAVFSTGDEIQSIGNSLQPGQIYDSNRYALLSALSRLNINLLDLGVIADDQNAIKQALEKADNEVDLVITSGGVSVGEADYLKDIVESIGSLDLWKMAIKPGKPFAYGKLKQAHFIGLPGNPVSCLVTLYQLAIPFIAKLQGQTDFQRPSFFAKTSEAIKKSAGRKNFIRGVLTKDLQGEITVKTTGSQGSGILSSISNANCFIILEADQTNVNAGESVLVEPFADILE
ncbi:MAG: molybdopterin molybdotransferase MoeA [Gammaproteobacteria bacterium]|nr:molybdopterin molybdotransferase MoeA [Gammaproteobacteria bacterium]